MKRLPNLDVLRFFLATTVLLFHTPRLAKNQELPYFMDWPIFNRGIEAVYMFFVLSGFLIIGQIVHYKAEEKFSIKDFYMRRALRILPLYYLIVFFGFLFYNGIVPLMGMEFEINYSLTEGLLFTMFFLPNVFAQLYEPGGILEILWSIGIEEQFYVLIAPMLYVIARKRILLFLSLLSVLYFIFFHLPWGYFATVFGMVYFFLFAGGIVAILERKKKLEFLKLSPFIPLFITVLTILFFTTNWLVFSERWVNNLFLSVLFSLFVHSISYNNWRVAVKNKWLNYFGKISYGIYMYHAIMLNFVVFLFMKFIPHEKIPDVWIIVAMNLMVLLSTLLVSHLSYRYFEGYFLRLKKKYRK